MNRRQFFGMTAAAVIAAGLSPLVLPDRTIFLPPRFGWHPAQLGAGYMREVSQYLINIGNMGWRYDAVGRDIWGAEHQFHVLMDGHANPEAAAVAIGKTFHDQGLIALPLEEGREFRLALPRCAASARYV